MSDLLTIIFGAVLFCLLVLVVRIDFKELRIPNGLNLAIALLGILHLWFLKPHSLVLHAATAVGIVVLLYAFRFVFNQLRGRDGLGQGDIKLFGASALWVSVWNLPMMILIAAGSALLFIGSKVGIAGMRNYNERLPFGPFIGFAFFTVWIWQEV